MDTHFRCFLLLCLSQQGTLSNYIYKYDGISNES